MAKLDDMTKAELIARDKRRTKAARNKGGGGGGGKFATRVKKLGKFAERAGQLYGTTNPWITMGSGRNVMNPSGELLTTPRSNGKLIEVRNPYTGAKVPTDLVMYDSIQKAFFQDPSLTFAGGSDTMGDRFRAYRAMTSYNIRSAFTPGGGIATTWAPAILGPLAGSGVRVALDGAADFARELRGLVKK